jgi:hypothetical protein
MCTSVVRPLAVLIGFAFCTSSPVSAQITYLKDQDPTAEISHTTVESIPGPTDRLTVGIKEQVSCAISNWKDPDIAVNGSAQTAVSDNYGTINWAASNGGSCVPAMGPLTTYTACQSATNTAETVTMTADDSNMLGNDDAIDVTLDFTVLVPASLTATKKADIGYGAAGVDNVGGKTEFWLQVNPITVSFKNVEFQENTTAQTRAFPNGQTQTYGGTPSAYTVAPNVAGAPNFHYRVYSSGKNAKGVLWGVPIGAPPGTPPAYINCTMIWSAPHEFKANGTWTEFDNAAMKNIYTGVTLKTTVTCKNVPGSDQGPWQ